MNVKLQATPNTRMSSQVKRGQPGLSKLRGGKQVNWKPYSKFWGLILKYCKPGYFGRGGYFGWILQKCSQMD